MEIIIYTDINNLQKDTLLKVISKVVDPTPLMAFDFKEIRQVMKSKFFGEVIIVFLISSKRELELLALNQESLFNTRYIIILPNDENSIVAKALSLYPRYLAYPSPEFKDVCAVIEKMIRNEAKKEGEKDGRPSRKNRSANQDYNY